MKFLSELLHVDVGWAKLQAGARVVLRIVGFRVMINMVAALLHIMIYLWNEIWSPVIFCVWLQIAGKTMLVKMLEKAATVRFSLDILQKSSPNLYRTTKGVSHNSSIHAFRDSGKGMERQAGRSRLSSHSRRFMSTATGVNSWLRTDVRDRARWVKIAGAASDMHCQQFACEKAIRGTECENANARVGFTASWNIDVFKLPPPSTRFTPKHSFCNK